MKEQNFDDFFAIIFRMEEQSSDEIFCHYFQGTGAKFR
jgi:hypothetical protein